MIQPNASTPNTTSPPSQAPLPQVPPGLPDLIPARMLNEFSYCPRLAYLEWVQSEFAPSADTLDGEFQHRRVILQQGNFADAVELADAGNTTEAKGTSNAAGTAAVPADAADSDVASSVMLSAPGIGLIAIVDKIETLPAADGQAAEVVPVEYKRSGIPPTDQRSYEPERIQLAAAGMILQEKGYRCTRGVIYYIASKTRIDVGFDEPLLARARELIGGLKAMVAAGRIPAPLVDSPKCPRCSLVSICLPDETRYVQLTHGTTPAAAPKRPVIRTIIATSDDKVPLYVQETRTTINKLGDALQVRTPAPERRVLAERPLRAISQVVLLGDVQISTQTLHALCEADIPVAYFSYGGWFYGMTTPLVSKNIELRIAQFARAADAGFALPLARAFTAGKIENQRTMLRRNHPSPPEMALAQLAAAADAARKADNFESLLGTEGNAARVYFENFNAMLKPRPELGKWPVDLPLFANRNRRPPADPVNAMLSYAYALLTKDFTAACFTVGLDPFMGFYHQPKFGKPALALDLMEEFRPIIADSAVITLINTGVIGIGDFVSRGGSFALKPEPRKRFLAAYERRLASEVTHPIFGYAISYRRTFEVQTRLLARVLAGELDAYASFTTR